MKNILKKFDRVGLMVLLAAFFVTVGFKATEKVEAGIWYEVSFIDPLGDLKDPANQEIVGLYPNGTPLNPCDTEDEELPICAVQLEGNLPSTFPISMDQAKTNGATSIATRHSEED